MPDISSYKRIDSDEVISAIEYCELCKEIYDDLVAKGVKYVELTSRYGHIMGAIEDSVKEDV